ncbi:MAG: hypothetical protein JW884_01730 [Deltaproteobacteria bacterium]|nr:hypothetical protein [Deltaproteobacteria bacterium]
MFWDVRYECPQCGAPQDLDEATRLVLCHYCGVRSFLSASDLFRFALPHKGAVDAPYYVPYLRFKGFVFRCEGLSIHHGLVDITRRAVDVPVLPVSLGYRPQTLVLRHLNVGAKGIIFDNTLHREDASSLAARYTDNADKGEVFHRSFIGESTSLIYLPLLRHESQWLEGVTMTPLESLDDESIAGLSQSGPLSPLIFLSTLCPCCGWNLQGEKTSIVLFCPNCQSAWEAVGGGWEKVPAVSVVHAAQEDLFLPFWRITAESSDGLITSQADLIRITGQPALYPAEREGRPLSFIVPAFKMRPDLFLRLSRDFTLMKKPFDLCEGAPRNVFSPVTLNASDALESLPAVCATASAVRHLTFPILKGLRFICKEQALLFLPFSETVNELIQRDASIAILRQAVLMGKAL